MKREKKKNIHINVPFNNIKKIKINRPVKNGNPTKLKEEAQMPASEPADDARQEASGITGAVRNDGNRVDFSFKNWPRRGDAWRGRRT